VTTVTFWLGRLVVLALALLLGATAIALFGHAESSGTRTLNRYVAALDGKLRFLRVGLRGKRLLGAQVLGAVGLVIAAAMNRGVLLLLLPLLALVPHFILERRVSERITKLESQIEPWLVAIANALKASPSLGEAIASSATVVPAPMSQEVETLIKEYELGTPLDRALDSLAERVPTRTLQSTVLALKIARKSGGDYAKMLENAAAALRELARLEGVVRTKTAEGRAQAYVIGGIPFPLILCVNWIDPRFFQPLLATFAGNLMIGAAVVLWMLAILLARKVLAVDV
jgi:tight adherence protein B